MSKVTPSYEAYNGTIFSAARVRCRAVRSWRRRPDRARRQAVRRLPARRQRSANIPATQRFIGNGGSVRGCSYQEISPTAYQPGDGETSFMTASFETRIRINRRSASVPIIDVGVVPPMSRRFFGYQGGCGYPACATSAPFGRSASVRRSLQQSSRVGRITASMLASVSRSKQVQARSEVAIAVQKTG